MCVVSHVLSVCVTPVCYTCGLHVWVTLVLYTCALHLCFTLVLYTCALRLCFTLGTTAHVDFEVFPILSEEIDGSQVVVEGKKRSRTKNERGEIGNGWKFGRRDGFGGNEYGRGFQDGEMG